MRLIFAFALTAAPLAVLAQTPPDVAVERVTLEPGQSASFTLAPGYDHQLLRTAEPGANGAITIRYESSDGKAVITAVSRTGYATSFTVLADPDGNGGFASAGDIALPGDGSTVTRSWGSALGTINVGNFAGGPQGGLPKPAGD